MNPTNPEDLITQISSLASQLARRTDLTEVPDPRRSLYELTSALASLTGPLDTLTSAGEYPDDITGRELNAPAQAMKDAVRAVHHLLGAAVTGEKDQHP
ncbi:hypothetical protein [Streptomyces sp. Ag109_G2-15]|uniref:hypothetical protein n=1 Tax=Streptomyces sp. Ag109_G2-15 TaxID=1938850 RepID=UPI000BC69765|nr:hypothetical protein [Streptomyces sp. Ag109_G2-15]SOE06505.1 hypothetical protein SAMN06272765_7325 [Streptomyces sp. Ag109_G2-15]